MNFWAYPLVVPKWLWVAAGSAFAAVLILGVVRMSTPKDRRVPLTRLYIMRMLLIPASVATSAGGWWLIQSSTPNPDPWTVAANVIMAAIVGLFIYMAAALALTRNLIAGVFALGLAAFSSYTGAMFAYTQARGVSDAQNVVNSENDRRETVADKASVAVQSNAVSSEEAAAAYREAVAAYAAKQRAVDDIRMALIRGSENTAKADEASKQAIEFRNQWNDWQAKLDCEMGQGRAGCTGVTREGEEPKPVTKFGKGPDSDYAREMRDFAKQQTTFFEQERDRHNALERQFQNTNRAALEAGKQELADLKAAREEAKTEKERVESSLSENVATVRANAGAIATPRAEFAMEFSRMTAGALMSDGAEPVSDTTILLAYAIAFQVLLDMSILFCSWCSGAPKDASGLRGWEFVGMAGERHTASVLLSDGWAAYWRAREDWSAGKRPEASTAPVKSDPPLTASQKASESGQETEEEFKIDGVRIPTLAEIEAGTCPKFPFSSKTTLLRRKLDKCKNAAQRERLNQWRAWRMGQTAPGTQAEQKPEKPMSIFPLRSAETRAQIQDLRLGHDRRRDVRRAGG